MFLLPVRQSRWSCWTDCPLCNTGIFIYCTTVLLPEVLVPVSKTTVMTNNLICISKQKHTTCNVFGIYHKFNM